MTDTASIQDQSPGHAAPPHVQQAGQWNRFWQQRSERPLGRIIRAVRRCVVTPMLARFVRRNTTRGTLIEAGCGTGEVSLHIARHRGNRVVLVDIAPDALDMARAHASSLGIQATTLQCDITTLSQRMPTVPDGIVYNVGVVEHFPDCAPVLREMAKVSGNFALAVIPEKTIFWRVFVSLSLVLKLVPPGFYIHLYDLCGFRRQVESAGLDVLRVDRMRLFGVISYLGICFRMPGRKAEPCDARP